MRPKYLDLDMFRSLWTFASPVLDFLQTVTFPERYDRGSR
jgi:hypothetical protein